MTRAASRLRALDAGRRFLAGLATVALAGLAGCPRPAFDGTFTAGPVRYRVGLPSAAWTRVDVADGQVTFVDGARGATLSAHAECRDTAAPLRALTGHVVLGLTERAVRAERLEALAGREALRTRLRARLDGVPQELEIVVLKKDGCIFDLVYSAPPATFAAGRPDFERFVAGFAKLPAAGDAP